MAAGRWLLVPFTLWLRCLVADTEQGSFSYYRGVPRLLWWIVLDDEEYEKRTSKSKELPSPGSKG